MSAFSATVLTLLHMYPRETYIDSLDPVQTWNFSRLDKLTLAAFLDDKFAIWVIIILMYVNSGIAYYFLFSFSNKMSEFEFYSQDTFLDRFVADHSIIITGVSKSLAPEQASRRLQRVFEYRFRGEDNKVVSCNTYRKNENVAKHWRRVKFLRSKIVEYE